ncbi:LysR family transcriptional regulator [Lactobacillus colini]|nr:LysR family transcriptional regulator [Lactobacillus colini]
MNLQHLIYFCELVKNPHMPSVAEQQQVSQSTLSYAISKLEDELGVPLFEKRGRHLALSIYGKLFYQYALTAVNSLKVGKNKVIDLSLGQVAKLRLGIGNIIDGDFVTGLITEFHKIFNKNKVTFDINHGTAIDLLKAVKDDQIQLAIVPMVNEDLKVSELKSIPLFKRHFTVALPSDHPLTSQNIITLKDLIAYPVIGFSDLSGIRPRLDQLWKENQLTVHYTAEADDIRTILDLVRASNSVALVPKLENQPTDGLEYRDLLEDETYTISLVEKKQEFTPRTVQLFEDCVREYCNERRI